MINLVSRVSDIKMKLLRLLLVTFVLKYCSHFDGALASDCSLWASQNLVVQENADPFLILLSKTSAMGGEIIKVDIQAVEGKSFKGFHLQAQSKEDGTQILGKFIEDEGEQKSFTFSDCGTKTHAAVTNSSNHVNQKISFKWKAPENFEGEVNFL